MIYVFADYLWNLHFTSSCYDLLVTYIVCIFNLLLHPLTNLSYYFSCFNLIICVLYHFCLDEWVNSPAFIIPAMHVCMSAHLCMRVCVHVCVCVRVCVCKDLLLKDEECERLSKVRDQLGLELEELTASLFQVGQTPHNTHNDVKNSLVELTHSQEVWTVRSWGPTSSVLS